jgi:hypothetical protein
MVNQRRAKILLFKIDISNPPSRDVISAWKQTIEKNDCCKT